MMNCKVFCVCLNGNAKYLFSWRRKRQVVNEERAARNWPVLTPPLWMALLFRSLRAEDSLGSDVRQGSRSGRVLTVKLTWGSPIPHIRHSKAMTGFIQSSNVTVLTTLDDVWRAKAS